MTHRHRHGISSPKDISTSGSIHRRAAIKKLLKLYLDNPYRRARRLGAPFVTVCRRFMRRAEVVLQRTISCPAGQFTLSRPTKNVPKAINANEKMENGKSTHSFSIFNSQLFRALDLIPVRFRGLFGLIRTVFVVLCAAQLLGQILLLHPVIRIHMRILIRQSAA